VVWFSQLVTTKENTMSKMEAGPAHSSAWVAQTWISFVVAVGITSMGIWFLPVDVWVKAFMAMGLLFSVGSTFSLAKTVRDQHESESLRKRIDEARVNRIIAEHDPLKPAL
jgi:hypothetical protein